MCWSRRTPAATTQLPSTVRIRFRWTLRLIYDASKPNPVVTVTFTTVAGDVTTKSVTLGHTVAANGQTYSNATGQTRYDNAKADWVMPVATPTHPSFFTGEVALSEGVFYLGFANHNIFGYYTYLSDPHFIYHYDLGFEYVFDAADGHSGVYFYDFKSGDFFYTSPTFGFPYLYDFNLKTALYYYPDPVNPGRYNTDGIRYFYRFDTGTIIVK